MDSELESEEATLGNLRLACQPRQRCSHMRNSLKKLALAVLPEPILLPLRKVHYARVLRSLTETYDTDFKVIKHIVGCGDRVIDLGAHVGACTKYLSDLVGGNGVVYSVEPFPTNFDILRSNVRKLKLRNVQLINCAVSDRPGRATMEVPRFTELGESFYDARLAVDGTDASLRRAEVEVKTVDQLFSGSSNQVSFVKCDVEGQELAALNGATRLIENSRPSWLIEVSLMQRSTHQKVCELLDAEGYQEFWFDGTILRSFKEGDATINAFFLQQRHVLMLESGGIKVRM
jgi:FkbM family methyltransferase